MCGIIGYVGSRQADPILLAGLKRLEYRGYDSSGLGVLANDDRMVVRKSQGKIARLEALMKAHPFPEGYLGISHTRWATHGAPNQINAHPHGDCSGRILVVHNGIIENYKSLKSRLEKQGHSFISDTDTEVIVHLIEEACEDGDLAAAVRKAIGQLRGTFALGVISADCPETLVTARIGSPLIIGVGDGEHYIASDVPAILDRTRKIVYLKDGQMAVLRPGRLEVMDFDGRRADFKVDTVDFDVEDVQKQGYDHFMLKEIHEQPSVIQRMIESRLFSGNVDLKGVPLKEDHWRGVRQVTVVACGTAYHAGLVGKYLIEHLARIPVSVEAASEFRYHDPIIDEKTLILAISQSGETADTLAAVREARRKGARVVSICNVEGSSLVRESDGVLYTQAGPEIGVASTKAYTAQLAMLYLFALKMGSVTGALADKDRQVLIDALKEIPALYQEVLAGADRVAQVARANSHFGCFLFLGRHVNYPSALEGALKLKEISYIPAEGYAAGEMKHGPIALIDEYRAVVCIAPQSPVYEKMVSNMQEIRARKGNIVTIATRGDTVAETQSHYVLYIPSTHDLLTPLVVALPLQLLAYYISVARGCDVDQPRNLAKSVTVE